MENGDSLEFLYPINPTDLIIVLVFDNVRYKYKSPRKYQFSSLPALLQLQFCCEPFYNYVELINIKTSNEQNIRDKQIPFLLV